MEEGGGRLVVEPGPPLGGRFRPPGDKSITHRAYLLGLLAAGETRVRDPNPGADCRATLAAARALGAGVVERAGEVVLRGTEGRLRAPGHPLDCGNSGTTLRLLAGVVAAHPIVVTLTGDASLSRRPVARIVEPLRRMGATLSAAAGDRFPPLEVRGGALRGCDFAAPTPSAQVASAILLAGLQSPGRTVVRTMAGVRDHTLRLLPAFGVAVAAAAGADGVTTAAVEGPATPRAASLRVPGDVSAAAFLLAAAAATPGACVTALGVTLNPTRTGFLETLREMGAAVEIEPGAEQAGEPTGDVTVTGPDRLRPADVPPARIPAMVDEIPAWAVAAAAAAGRSTVRGAGELRVKESDRLAALAADLAALGIACEELPDGLAIEGGRPRGGRVAARGDHRMAMACAMLATRAGGPVTIDGAACIATSFPGFAATLAALGGRIREEPDRAR